MHHAPMLLPAVYIMAYMKGDNGGGVDMSASVYIWVLFNNRMDVRL